MQTLFPHIPISMIIEDLRVTRSVELTIENILDNRLIAPTMFRDLDMEPQPSRPLSTLQTDPLPNVERNWDEYNNETMER